MFFQYFENFTKYKKLDFSNSTDFSNYFLLPNIAKKV